MRRRGIPTSLKLIVFIFSIAHGNDRDKRQINFGGGGGGEGGNHDDTGVSFHDNGDKSDDLVVEFDNSGKDENKKLSEILAGEVDVPVVTRGFLERRVAGNFCRTPRGDPGVCSFIFENRCSPILNLILRFGPDPRIINYLIKAIQPPCGYDRTDFTLCCADSNAFPTTTTTTTTRRPRPPPPPPPRPPPTQLTECGISKFQNRIIGGVEAESGAWPWAVILGSRSSNGGFRVICGGTLIDNRHVLTAAHCFHNGNATTSSINMVRLGEHDVTSSNDGAIPVDLRIAKVNVHWRFRRTTLENDIALLTLERPVRFTDRIRPACLPTTLVGANFLHALRNDPTIIGWGSIKVGGRPVSTIRQAFVPIVALPTCARAYRNVASVSISRTQVCAGEGRTDTCTGDSGGPMLTSQPGRWTIIGITSFGVECARSAYPGVYTRVDQFLPWITANSNA